MAPASSAFANLGAGKRLLGWAAPLGRMAFTNYLAQSVILGWIFYGYGLGLFGKLGVTSALAIAVRDLHRTGILQRVVARPLPLRPGRMAVAHADVWGGAADGAVSAPEPAIR